MASPAAAAQSAIASSSAGAVSDRAPTLFGIVLIILGLFAAFALATGRLQAVWAAITGASSSSSSTGAVAPAPAAGSVPTAAPGSNSSWNGLGAALLPSFNQEEYQAPNIAQPQVAPAAAPTPNPYSTAAYPVYSGAPSVSTPYSVYGAYA